MRIASYNIRKAVGLDWRRKPDRIVDVLAEIDADVVILQEADKRIGERAGVLPVERLQSDLGYKFADMSIRPKSHGWHGNAILVRDRLKVGNANRIEIPSKEPRGAVSVFLPETGLEVVGVHLALGLATRKKQLAMMKTYIQSQDHPVLVSGDFNEWRKEGALAELLGTGYQIINPGKSFHAAAPMASLDRFILTREIEFVSSHVHQSALAKRASDHLPIVIDIKLEKIT